MQGTFRGSGGAPNTQSWAISLRSSSGPRHKTQKLSHPPMRHGSSSTLPPRMDMLALAKHMREWRRGVRPVVRGALRRWRRKAAVQRLRAATAVTSLDEVDLETLQRFGVAWRRFALRMAAWASTRAIGRWRAWYWRVRERHVQHARADALRHVHMTLSGWSALSYASGLSTWRATNARHLLRVAHAHRLRVAARSWQRRCLHIDVGRGALQLGVLSAALVAWRRAMGRWRRAIVASARLAGSTTAAAELAAGRALRHAMRRMCDLVLAAWRRASIARAADRLGARCRGDALRTAWRRTWRAAVACAAFGRAVCHASAVTDRRTVLRAFDSWHQYSRGTACGGCVSRLTRVYLLRASQRTRDAESHARGRIFIPGTMIPRAWMQPLGSCAAVPRGAAMAAIMREAHASRQF